MISAPEMFPTSLLLLAGWPVGWGMGIVVAGLVLGIGYFAYRQRRMQEKYRQELRRTEERVRRSFEEATVAIMEEDFTEVQERLEQLRERGVTDLRTHLAANPALAAELFKVVRIKAANRRALVMMDAIDLADYIGRMRKHTEQSAPAAFTEELVALWEGRDTVVLEVAFRAGDGQQHRGVLQWTLRHEGGVRDFTQVQIVFTDLTALRVSEERYQQLFEGAAEGVYEILPAGELRSANPAFARMLGFGSTGELLAQGPEALERLYAAPGRRREFFAALAREDYLKDFESEIRRADGSVVWLAESVRVVRDSTGSVQYFQGFATDVTARRQAEVALRESEERWRLAVQGSAAGIWENNVQTGVAFYSDRSKEMLGFAPHEMSNQVQDWVARIHPDDVPLGIQAMRDHMAGAKPYYQVEHRFRCKDGTYKWILSRGQATVDGQRRLLRVVGTHVDINERKLAEQALSAERERLTVTLQSMAEGVVTVDNTGVVRFINGSACGLTGRTEAEAVGRQLGEVCVLRHEKTGAPLAAPEATVRVENRVVELPPLTVLAQPGGGLRLVEGRCAPLHDLGGRTIGAVLVLHDVTDQSRLEHELQRASKLESVGVLAGGIAHDFNNILAIIMGNLTLAMLDQRVRESPAQRWLRDAESGALRARDLTQQLLTFAKGGEPVRATVQLPEVVREAAEFALHGAAVRCEFAISDGLWPAEVDKGQIGQVVQNLVINAVQAMPGGGVLRIALANDALTAGARPPLPAGNYLKMTVADRGVGIRPEYLPRLFEPYFTTKDQGVGLGLATVYSILKKHHGLVTVESQVNVGTTFQLWLPASASPVSARPSTRSSFGELKGRVLFMDDEEPIRSMAAVLLARLGLEAVTAEDGAEAVRLFQQARETQRPFDVVVMDLTVPGGMGGLQALQEMRALDPEVRAIVSSGYSSDPVLANFRAHGFRGMVAKPYRITDLAEALRAVLAEPRVAG